MDEIALARMSAVSDIWINALSYTDPRLLRYLHRQAVSNACKFGKPSGPVLTQIIYNEERQNAQINIISLPDEYHDRLVAMGSAVEVSVFKKGYHLRITYMNY